MTTASEGAEPQAERLPAGRDVLWMAAVALVYFATARLSLRLLFEPQGIAAIWPPEGIFLCAILLTRREMRLWLVAVLFATDFAAEMLAGTSAPVSAVYALALTGSAVFSAWLLLRYVGPRIDFGRLRDLVGFLGLAVVLSNATMSLLAAAAATTVPGSPSFWRSWSLWAASNGVGNLVVTPLVLSWATLRWSRPKPARARSVLEALALFLSLSLLSFLAFRYVSDHGTSSVLIASVVLPFLVWAALRFGVRGTSVAVVVVATAAVWGAFASELYAVIAVQLYIASAAVPALILVAVVTERKQVEEALRETRDYLEQRVLDRTAELDAVNQELEAFAYSVSHDLRAPLRHISGFSALLAERVGDDLDEKSRHYVETISRSVREMGVLIDDLLQFSRTGRAELKIEAVDMDEVLAEALEPLQQETSERDIEWSVDSVPTVVGDHALLRQVWANLLGNAVKYTRDKAPARIEVGARSGDEEREDVFWVRDNGVGFDMQYVHKLYGVFQRLHSTAEFEGTGIGLANVQRIVSKLGGRVWAEGKINEGATFYFALPRRKESPS